MTIAEFCAQFGAPVPPHARLGRRHFLDPCGLATHPLAKDAFSFGLFLGEDRGRFMPTTALLDLIAPHVPRRVVVTQKAAWMFLCGKDILMEGVVRADDYSAGDVAIVADERGNILGYGEVKNRPDLRHAHKQFLKHRLDRGEYLRREK